jgi:ubiquinone/menaquinone biosynthesis C-methylase UbiE
VDEPVFRSDLYRGTAPFYDRYRVGYPSELLDDLCARAAAGGAGRLLDLACGTGQVTFPLCSRFSDVTAVDWEPETVAFAQAKADRLGMTNVQWFVGRAEDVPVSGLFELVTIGTAFHRLNRRAVARRTFEWLAPGGHLALLWSNPPSIGERDWQQVMAQVVQDWIDRAETGDRLIGGLDATLADKPHRVVLEDAGLLYVGKFEFLTAHTWTVDELAGVMYSTSMLSHEALGEHVDAFERDLARRLLEVVPDGRFDEEISFAYDLAVRP